VGLADCVLSLIHAWIIDKGVAPVQANVIVVNPRDNVAVALIDIPQGGMVMHPQVESFPACNPIPCSHKVALCDLEAGDRVLKYGETIGQAAQFIQKGEWVHTHNLEEAR
jgi:altronate dehydratase